MLPAAKRPEERWRSIREAVEAPVEPHGCAALGVRRRGAWSSFDRILLGDQHLGGGGRPGQRRMAVVVVERQRVEVQPPGRAKAVRRSVRAGRYRRSQQPASAQRGPGRLRRGRSGTLAYQSASATGVPSRRCRRSPGGRPGAPARRCRCCAPRVGHVNQRWRPLAHPGIGWQQPAVAGAAFVEDHDPMSRARRAGAAVRRVADDDVGVGMAGEQSARSAARSRPTTTGALVRCMHQQRLVAAPGGRIRRAAPARREMVARHDRGATIAGWPGRAAPSTSATSPGLTGAAPTRVADHDHRDRHRRAAQQAAR